jgi:hypothetical protein
MAVVAGTTYAEEQALQYLKEHVGEAPTLEAAIRHALTAWGIARRLATQEEREQVSEREAHETLREILDSETHVEAGVLERQTLRENRFRLLRPEEIAAAMP